MEQRNDRLSLPFLQDKPHEVPTSHLSLSVLLASPGRLPCILFAALTFLGFTVLPPYCSLRMSISYHSRCNCTCLLSTCDLLHFVSSFVEKALGSCGHLE